MRWRGFLTFIVWPCVEVAVAIAIAQQVGWGPVIAVQLLVSFFGLLVLRSAGRHSARALGRLAAGESVPTAGETADTGLRFLAGLLLFVPGFVSDAVGVLLTIPPVRVLVLALIGTAVARRTAGWVGYAQRLNLSGGRTVIAGEVVREDQPPGAPPRPPGTTTPPALPGSQ
jgi:UPF0716 protein FxsA